MARPTTGWIPGGGCGDAAAVRKLGSSARRRTLAFTIALCFIMDASTAVAGVPLQKLASRSTGGDVSDGGSAASAVAYSADNGQASSQLRPSSPLDPPAAFALSRTGDECLESSDCIYPENSLALNEKRLIGDSSQDDDEAEIGGDADEHETEEFDRTAGGGSGGGGGGGGDGNDGVDDELDEQSEERRLPGDTSFGNNKPGIQLSRNKMATAFGGDEAGGNGNEGYDEDGSDSVNATATIAVADSEQPARRIDWRNTEAPAEDTTSSAVGASKEVNGGDAAAETAAEDDDGGSDTRPLAPKILQQPCSDGAPAGVSFELLKASAVGGKGIRGAADVNATLDNGNLSAVLATTFGSVSVVLLLLINGFVIRRTWMHGCRQKKSQVLLRPRRVACRRRHNRYGTTRSTDPDETEM